MRLLFASTEGTQVSAAALEAVAELPIRVLLSTGGNEIELGGAPSNFHMETWVAERTSWPTPQPWSATEEAARP